jgi:hypothetical protein
MTRRTRLAVSDNGDTFNFHVGVVCVLNEHGQLVHATRWQRAKLAASDYWRSTTRWFRPRTVVSDVDVEEGSVTMVTERWSWRRWRWERTG